MHLEHLQIGDVVDVVAPASACDRADLAKGIRALRSLGLVPRVPKNLLAKSLLFSNTDEQRLQQLKRAVYARDSKMIWCVRGGYGALRLMPDIEKWKRPKHSKIFLGYSDITTLHVHLNQKWKWPTLHAPMLERLGRGALTPQERRELLGIIFGTQSRVQFTGLKPLNSAARQRKVVRGPILGGNLAVLQSALGTPSVLKPKKCILFFEDIGERPHRVDRMLEQMKQAGWFDQTKAIILGEFLLSDKKDRRGLWTDVIPRFAKDMKIPILSGMPVGHGDGRQRTLPLNTASELHLGSKPSLVVDSGIFES